MNSQTFSLSTFRIVFMAAAILLATQPVYAAKFSNKSVKGCYVGSMQGKALPELIIRQDPSLQLPHSSVLRICANGKGKGKVTAIWNIAGVCILEQEGSVRYSITSDGTGNATAKVTNATVSPGCAFIQPPVLEKSKADFGFAAAIDGGGCLEMIGTTLITDPKGAAAPLPIVSQGRACKQK